MSSDVKVSTEQAAADEPAVAADQTSAVDTAAAEDDAAAAEDDPEPSDLATCMLCSQQVTRETTYRLNDQTACAACTDRVRDELAQQAATPGHLAAAAACGVVGALVGALVWAGVGIATDLEVGYIAVLVGYLTGRGINLGAGKQRGAPFQYIAVGLAVLGLLAAKYFLFSHVVVQLIHDRGGEVGHFDGLIWASFPAALGEMLGVLDVVFLILAVMAAYRVPKAGVVSIVKV